MTNAELEAALDRTYFRHPLPHPNKVLATWYYLTASEDHQRNLFTSMGAAMPIGRMIFYLDKFKYSMRYALDRIAKEATDRAWSEVPRRVVPKLYIIAARLVHAGVDYSLASQLCGAMHTGTAIAIKDPDAWRVRIDESHHDKAYGALELIGVGKLGGPDLSMQLFHWLRNPSSVPAVVQQIGATIQLKKRLITYEYRQDLASELAMHIGQPEHLIPDAWKFEWGGRAEVTLLLNALSLRCMYHILAVHFGSCDRQLRGGGESSIVLIVPRDQLVADLELLSSLDRDRIDAFVDNLTWGHGTTTPDPALQPLIQIRSDLFAIPCIHLLSSNQERNLLSLMARTQAEEFDAQSHLFEREMVSALLSTSRPAGVEMRSNVRLHIDGREEEIDILVIDEHDRRLLVCELRWILGPGDPREVQNRKKECLKKVDQVRRKVERISASAGMAAATALGRKVSNDSADDWVTTGVVLIAGFGGRRSPDPKYPIIPVALFERAMAKTSCLEALASWCEGLSWLPREGKHFNVATMEIVLADSRPLIVQGAEMPDSAVEFVADAVACLSHR